MKLIWCWHRCEGWEGKRCGRAASARPSCFHSCSYESRCEHKPHTTAADQEISPGVGTHSAAVPTDCFLHFIMLNAAFHTGSGKGFIGGQAPASRKRPSQLLIVNWFLKACDRENCSSRQTHYPQYSCCDSGCSYWRQNLWI